jgi:hypothetical protein
MFLKLDGVIGIDYLENNEWQKKTFVLVICI